METLSPRSNVPDAVRRQLRRRLARLGHNTLAVGRLRYVGVRLLLAGGALVALSYLLAGGTAAVAVRSAGPLERASVLGSLPAIPGGARVLVRSVDAREVVVCPDEGQAIVVRRSDGEWQLASERAGWARALASTCS